MGGSYGIVSFPGCHWKTYLAVMKNIQSRHEVDDCRAVFETQVQSEKQQLIHQYSSGQLLLPSRWGSPNGIQNTETEPGQYARATHKQLPHAGGVFFSQLKEHTPFSDFLAGDSDCPAPSRERWAIHADSSSLALGFPCTSRFGTTHPCLCLFPWLLQQPPVRGLVRTDQSVANSHSSWQRVEI